MGTKYLQILPYASRRPFRAHMVPKSVLRLEKSEATSPVVMRRVVSYTELIQTSNAKKNNKEYGRGKMKKGVNLNIPVKKKSTKKGWKAPLPNAREWARINWQTQFFF